MYDSVEDRGTWNGRGLEKSSVLVGTETGTRTVSYIDLE